MAEFPARTPDSDPAQPGSGPPSADSPSARPVPPELANNADYRIIRALLRRNHGAGLSRPQSHHGP